MIDRQLYSLSLKLPPITSYKNRLNIKPLRYSSMNEATLRKTHCYIGYETTGGADNCNSEIQLVLTERGVCYQVNANKRIPLEEGMLGAVNILTLVDLNKSLRAELLNGVEVFVKDQGSFPNRYVED